MKIQMLGDCEVAPATHLEAALMAASGLITKTDPPIFHRDFAAVAIAYQPNVTKLPSDNDLWVVFQGSIVCRAWIGNPDGYRKAERDYMANAWHKAFTTWRTGKDNSQVLRHDRCLSSLDSKWPGAIWHEVFPRRGLAIATSGLNPHEDEMVSTIISRCLNYLKTLAIANDPYRALYPTDGLDTIGGESFNHPPDWSDWP